MGGGVASRGDDLNLVAVGVLKVGGVNVRAPGLGMAVGEQQRPAVPGSLDGQIVDLAPVACIEGQVVQPSPAGADAAREPDRVSAPARRRSVRAGS